MPSKVFAPLHLYFFGIIFFAGTSMMLLIYALLSPYWFLVNPREYSHIKSTRVIGLWDLLEGVDKVNLRAMWDDSGFRRDEHYNLALRRQHVCENSQYGIPDRDYLGLDVEDMELLGDIKVPCKDSDYYADKSRAVSSLPIPIPPADRLTVSEKEDLHSTRKAGGLALDSLILEQDCGQHRRDRSKLIKCPPGYRNCPPGFSVGWCYADQNADAWPRLGCCSTLSLMSAVGGRLYNDQRLYGYVQVFGWAQWQVKELLIGKDDEKRWCSVRELRCQFLTDIETIGTRYGILLVVSVCLLGVITGFALSGLRECCPSIILVTFVIATALATFVIIGFQRDFGRLLKLNMTRRDQWGRPFVHPMINYNSAGRTIENGWKARYPNAAAEWVYYHLNARVDFGTYDKDTPHGFRDLWALTLGKVGVGAAAIGTLISLELMFVLHCQLAPFQRFCEVLLAILVIPLTKIKYFIDNYIAAYPVLWVYPWQKLYPNSFPAGQWLGCPWDQIWDLTVGLFAHLVRAIWDYPTCQDICSPLEKKALAQLGIYNDRLRNLLVSRRSYFVLMALLGSLKFTADLLELLYISRKETQYREAASANDRYPFYQCNFAAGYCPIETPDLQAYGNYTSDMLLKVYSIVELGCNSNESLQQLIEWIGGFISVACACAALWYWTNFAKSRRFCLIGWISMMLTPAVTSSFSANYRLDWAKEEEAVVNSLAELWEDMSLWLATKPCEQMADTAQNAMDQATYACSWVKTLSLVVPHFLKDGCKKYNNLKEMEAQKMVISNITSFCQKSANYWADGPKTREEFEAKVRKDVQILLLGTRLLVGLRSGVQNMLRIIPAVTSMVPALLQGSMMVKNIVPRQTMPSILTTMPWAYTLVFWAQYQMYYQFMDKWMFLVALLSMSFAQMFYYIFGKHYHLHQPMCDQQSVTVTFRIWYYCAITAFVTPYIIVWIFLGWFNDFLVDVVWFNVIGWILDPSMRDILKVICGGIMSYTYTIQAGVDWFVDELVQHHLAAHAPLVLASSKSAKEFRHVQKRLGTDIDVDLIETGTYVCGGLSDPNRLYPPENADWRHKAQLYSTSLALKDFATLDAFSEHILQDGGLTEILNAGRRPWYAWMQNGPYAPQHGARSRAPTGQSDYTAQHGARSRAPTGQSDYTAQPGGRSRAPTGHSDYIAQNGVRSCLTSHSESSSRSSPSEQSWKNPSAAHLNPHNPIQRQPSVYASNSLEMQQYSTPRGDMQQYTSPHAVPQYQDVRTTYRAMSDYDQTPGQSTPQQRSSHWGQVQAVVHFGSAGGGWHGGDDARANAATPTGGRTPVGRHTYAFPSWGVTHQSSAQSSIQHTQSS